MFGEVLVWLVVFLWGVFCGVLFFFGLLDVGKIGIIELNLLFLWYMAG